MQKFNYHTHTYRCGHADDNMMDEEYVKEFIDKGFKKIAFTDHSPEKETIDKRQRMRMDYSQINEYLTSIKNLKEKYKDKIDIQTGFEIEFLPGQEKNLLELKQMTDILVLGQHFIYADDNKDLKIFRKHKFNDEDLIKYANYIDTAMKLQIPDIVVHPDLYMLTRNEFGEIEKKVAEMICKSAEKYNIPLEINLTEAFMYLANLKNKISYPCRGFWEVATNYNIKVIYGIDAHYKEQIRLYEDSIEMVNKIIGKETIEKLSFCNDKLEI
ncbi:MAG: histidinol-phosphatase [Bacilli bacterium]|nr:histidinol-phosphatase [Bacilli bacterium]